MIRTMAIVGIILLGATSIAAQQTYPNITGETILEDDRIIVQRFVLQPGQPEGIHEHPEHQLVIVLQSSNGLVTRFRGEETRFDRSSDEPDRPGGIGAFWRPGPVLLSDQHESINTGTRPLEWIAITFKKESIALESPLRPGQ